MISPHYPPIDGEFFKDMFVHFADILDKRIENVIEQKMVKVEKKEKNEKKEEEKDETEDLIGNEVQNFEFFFTSKKSTSLTSIARREHSWIRTPRHSYTAHTQYVL